MKLHCSLTSFQTLYCQCFHRWEIIPHKSLMFLLILVTEALCSFVLDNLFKDIYTSNNLGGQR